MSELAKKPARPRKPRASKAGVVKKVASAKAPRKKTQPKPKKEEGVGLGDVVEKVTKATGIKAAVDWFSEVTGVDCGCDKRKEEFNKIRLFAGWKKPKCLTLEQYNRLQGLLEGVEKRITREQAKGIAKIYSEIFGTRYEIWCSSCPEIWRTKITEIKYVLEVYESGQPKN